MLSSKIVNAEHQAGDCLPVGTCKCPALRRGIFERCSLNFALSGRQDWFFFLRRDTVWVAEFWADQIAKIDIHTRKVTEYVPGRHLRPVGGRCFWGSNRAVGNANGCG